MAITQETVQYITDKLDFINEEMGMFQVSLDLLRTEVGLLKVNIAILETQMSGILWMNRIIIGGVAVLIVGQLWKMMLNYRNGRKNNV